MKLHVNPDGSFDVDVSAGEEKSAVSLIRELQAKPGDKVKPEDAPASLNQVQYETWAWLVEHDCEDGIHFTAFARALGITEKAAHNRFYRLKEAGYAYTLGLSRGRYRAKI
jgi:hypothetical protein